MSRARDRRFYIQVAVTYIDELADLTVVFGDPSSLSLRDTEAWLEKGWLIGRMEHNKIKSIHKEAFKDSFWIEGDLEMVGDERVFKPKKFLHIKPDPYGVLPALIWNGFEDADEKATGARLKQLGVPPDHSWRVRVSE